MRPYRCATTVRKRRRCATSHQQQEHWCRGRPTSPHGITGATKSPASCRFGDRHRVLIATEQRDLVARSDLALLRHREVEAAAAAAVEALDHVGASEADGEFVAGHTRLRDDELRAADREA